MIVLADTSAWIEVLRRTGSSTDQAMQARLTAGEVAVTDLTVMEVLAGATTAARVGGIEAALDACRYVVQRRLIDATAAAQVYRECRRQGETPRQVNDCLVAAVAIRNDIAVLHRDRDFEVIARHTPLKLASA